MGFQKPLWEPLPSSTTERGPAGSDPSPPPSSVPLLLSPAEEPLPVLPAPVSVEQPSRVLPPPGLEPQVPPPGSLPCSWTAGTAPPRALLSPAPGPAPAEPGSTQGTTPGETGSPHGHCLSLGAFHPLVCFHWKPFKDFHRQLGRGQLRLHSVIVMRTRQARAVPARCAPLLLRGSEPFLCYFLQLMSGSRISSQLV